jgi:hypothetical protein
MAPQDLPGPAVARSDPVGLREGDPEHHRSPASTGSGSGFRASPRDCSTMARSPLGECRPASEQTRDDTAPRANWRADHLAHSLSFAREERWGKECTRVSTRNWSRLVLKCRNSRSTVHRRWMACSALSWPLAQVGEVIFGPGLRCDLWSSRGPGRTRIGL